MRRVKYCFKDIKTAFKPIFFLEKLHLYNYFVIIFYNFVFHTHIVFLFSLFIFHSIVFTTNERTTTLSQKLLQNGSNIITLFFFLTFVFCNTQKLRGLDSTISVITCLIVNLFQKTRDKRRNKKYNSCLLKVVSLTRPSVTIEL